MILKIFKAVLILTCSIGLKAKESDLYLPNLGMNKQLKYMPNLAEETSIKRMLRVGVGTGVMLGVQNAVAQTLTGAAAPIAKELADPIVALLKYPFNITTQSLQYLLFGSQRLAWNDVAKLNNALYELIHPLTAQSLGDFGKDRRADFIGAKKEGVVIVDKDWDVKKQFILVELSTILSDIQERNSCYCIENVSLLRRPMCAFISFFIPEQKALIARELAVAAQYITEIKNLIEVAKVAKELDEHRDLLKFLLGRSLRAFKNVGIFINEKVATLPAGSQQVGFVKFHELTAQGANNLAGLDQLFGGDAGAGA